MARRHQISVQPQEVELTRPTAERLSQTEFGVDGFQDATWNLVSGALTSWLEAEPQIELDATLGDPPLELEVDDAGELAEQLVAESDEDAVIAPLWATDVASSRWQLMVDMLLAGATGAMIHAQKIDRESAARWLAFTASFNLRPPKDT